MLATLFRKCSGRFLLISRNSGPKRFLNGQKVRKSVLLLILFLAYGILFRIQSFLTSLQKFKSNINRHIFLSLNYILSVLFFTLPSNPLLFSGFVALLGKKETFKLSTSPPKSISNDWIGPPDAKSNLRPTHFYIPPNETNVEKELRLKRLDLQVFNHHFWTRQNITFFKRKAQFIQMELERKKQLDSDTKSKSLSPEEMSVFYKQFLEENYQNNLKYHRDWYKKNIFLLWPALKVAIQNLFKKAK